MNTITTRVKGPQDRIIHLVHHTPAANKLIELWPLPILEAAEIPNHYGVLFGTRDFELTAFKFQLPDMDYERACHFGTLLAGLVAAGTARLARAGCSGTIVPAVYLRQKDDHTFETGVAVFCNELTDRATWDLCAAFIEAIPIEIAGVSLPALPHFVGAFERRQYSHLEQIFLETAILSGELVLISPEMPDIDDLVWAALTEPGTEARVPHVPCTPVTLDLPVGELMAQAGYGEA